MNSLNQKPLMRVFAFSAVIVACLVFTAGNVRAADHRDSPRTTADPPADINDIYAWMTSDAGRMNLIMTLSPAATEASKFSDAVRYVFHVNSSPSAGGPAAETQVVCTFNVQQQVSCNVGNRQVIATRDASATSGVTVDNGRFRIFTGLRSDPFFFAFDAFNSTVSKVVAAAPQLQFNEAGCPSLDINTQKTLAESLRGPNFFEGLNTLAIVIQADKTLFGPGPIYGVWGSTERVDGTMVDRMGRPGVSTALIGTFLADSGQKGALKDSYNSAPLAGSSTFANEIARSLAIYDSLVGTCGDNKLTATGTGANTYSTFAGALAQDQLLINGASGTCDQYLAVELGMGNQCGGRAPSMDVIDVTLSALAAGQTSGVTDGVDSPTRVSSNSFPFLRAPNSGAAGATGASER